MATDITLTAASRANLLSLQNTASLIGRTQKRLATGQKVASPIDDASKYFRAKGLSDRAQDFDAAKDNITQALETVNASIRGLEAATKIVEQLRGLAQKAQASADTNAIAIYQTAFNNLIGQLNTLVFDASYSGKNLINGTSGFISVNFNENAAIELTITGTSNNNTGLAIVAAAGWATSATNIDTSLGLTAAALITLRSNAETLGSNAALLQIRTEFTQNYVNTLEDGSNALTLADSNEEGANLVSLQTRQQLGVVSLSIASQSEQSILRLFS